MQCFDKVNSSKGDVEEDINWEGGKKKILFFCKMKCIGRRNVKIVFRKLFRSKLRDFRINNEIIHGRRFVSRSPQNVIEQTDGFQ